jgi:hypothetical protein
MMLPADVDGTAGPDAQGGILYTELDDVEHGGGGSDRALAAHARLRDPGEQHVYELRRHPDRAVSVDRLRVLRS